MKELIIAIIVATCMLLILNRYIIRYKRGVGFLFGRNKPIGKTGVTMLRDMWEQSAKDFAVPLPKVKADVLSASEIEKILRAKASYHYGKGTYDEYVSSVHGELPWRGDRMKKLCGKRTAFAVVPPDHEKISYGKEWFIDLETGNSWEKEWLKNIK